MVQLRICCCNHIGLSKPRAPQRLQAGGPSGHLPMDSHVEQNWEATLEELVACSAILQDGFRCWAGSREVTEFTTDEADSLREQGPGPGNHLSCSAVVHLPLPEAGLTIQV